MAVIERWYEQDLKKPVTVQAIGGNVFSLDNNGALIGVKVYDDGEAAELTGSVTAYCTLADGQTVSVAGTREENRVYILMPQSALAVPGTIKIVIKLTDSSVITTLAALIGTVYRSRSDTVITPSSQIITDWAAQLAAELQNCVDARTNLAGIIAAAFAEGTANAAGTYVTKDGNLYLLPNGHEANTTWANTTKTQVTAGGEICNLKSALGENFYIYHGSYQSSGTAWDSRYYGAFFKVIPGSTYSITAGSSGSVSWFGSKNINLPPEVGDAPVFSEAEGWTAWRTNIAKNTTETGVIPDDVYYLYMYAGQNTDYTRLPAQIIINGIKYYDSVFTDINILSKNIVTLSNSVTNNGQNITQNAEHIADINRFLADEIYPTKDTVVVSGRYDDGSWTGQSSQYTKTALIPVKAGDIVEIFSTDLGSNSPIACIKDLTHYPPVNGDTITLSDYSPWNEVINVTKNYKFVGIVPPDAKYFLSYYGNDSSLNRKPLSIKINGYEYIISTHENISAITKPKGIVPFYVSCYISGTTWAYDDRYRSLVYPVQSGDIVSLYAYGFNSSQITVVTSYPQNGATLPFSSDEDYNSTITIPRARYFEGQMPSDAAYLIVYCGAESNPRTPDALFINGVEVINNVPNMFNTYNNPVANIRVNNVISINHAGHYDPDGTPSQDEAPANSIAAFKMAKTHGFTWIETDVHFTKNNIPVMCHDDAINDYARIPTGDPSDPESQIESTVKISEITYSQLLSYDFCVVHGRVKTQYVGNKITTFENLLKFARCVGLNISVEIKTDVTYTNEQLDILITLARKYGMNKNIEWRSADGTPLLYISGKYPFENFAINASPSSTETGAYNAIGLGRRLLTGHNYVAISMNNSLAETFQKAIVDNGFVLETGVDATAEGVASLSPYASRVFTNSIPVDQLLYEQGMNM